MLLKFMHIGRIHSILWKPIVHCDHSEDGPKEQGKLIPGFVEMTIKLSVVSTRQQWLAHISAEW